MPPESAALMLLDAEGQLTLEMPDHKGRVIAYAAEVRPPGLDDFVVHLTRLDGEDGPYRIARCPAGLWRCDCKDAQFRAAKERRHCKHSRLWIGITTRPDGTECRPIQGLPGYFIGADGTPWSARVIGRAGGALRQPEDWAPLSIYRRPYGARYCVVCFRPTPGGAVVQRYVHRLVLEAFVGPCPDGMECLHADFDTANNRASNLRWGTHLENIGDGVRQGRHSHGERHPAAKLNESAVRTIRRLAAEGVRHRVIAEPLGISPRYVSAVVCRRVWRHVTD